MTKNIIKENFQIDNSSLRHHISNVNNSIVARFGNGNEHLSYNNLRYVGYQPQSTFKFKGCNYNFNKNNKSILDSRKKAFKISSKEPPPTTNNCSIWFHHVFESGDSRHWQVFLNHFDIS